MPPWSAPCPDCGQPIPPFGSHACKQEAYCAYQAQLVQHEFGRWLQSKHGRFAEFYARFCRTRK